MEDLDSVEVIKGPASVFYGQGRPGGMINVTSKLPGADHVNSAGFSADAITAIRSMPTWAALSRATMACCTASR